MALPLLSTNGTLDFLETADLLRLCEQLRARGEFEVQISGASPGPVVQLHIRIPGQAGPLSCAATLRPIDAGRAILSLGRATADILTRLDRAAEALRGLASASPSAGMRPRRVTTPLPMTPPARPSTPQPATPPAAPPPPVAAAPPREPRATMPFVSVVAPPLSDSGGEPSPLGPLRGRLERPTHVEDLRGVFHGRPDSASLASTHLGALLRQLTLAGAGGRLSLVGARTKRFWIAGGRFGLSEAQPPRPEEMLGHLVIKMGRLMSSQPIDEAVALARRTGRRTGDVLVERGVIQPRLLDSALRQQCELRLLEASEWPRADYEFAPGEGPPVPGPMPLCGSVQLQVALARHVASRATAHDLQARYEAFHMRYGRLRPLADVEEAALLGDHKTASTLRHAFPGTHRLRDALAGCPLGKLPTMRLIVLLEAYGALETAPEALVLASGTDQARTLLHRVAQARAHDHFQRLGAHAGMHADRIREAFARATSEYGPEGPWARVSPDAASQMLRLAEESYGLLGDAAARKRYRRELLGQDRARFVADLLCAHAHALAQSGQPQHVRPLAEVALELADLPDARALLA